MSLPVFLTTIGGFMTDYTELQALEASVLDEMRQLNYSDHTIVATRRMFDNLSRYANSHGVDCFSESLAVEFLNDKFGTDLRELYQGNPEGVHMKNHLRAMRILLEYDLCGCICRRMPGALARTKLPSGLQALLDSFNGECRRNGLSESTIYSRGNRIKRFLIFLADSGGVDAGCFSDSSAHDYILTQSSNHAKSVKSILTAIRCFYRHLYLEGFVDRDLTGTVPSPKLYYSPELPAPWAKEEVEALMGCIDRGNPAGKRDYAMLLMVARLGLRASDIKAICISDFDWEARTVSIVQHKTKVPLVLPLLDDVGWAVIDYLRYGRPEGAACPELFVRHVAPFEPFAENGNLTNILVKHARAAGVKAPRDRKTLHSLRHALAKRLLEQQVPLEDISRILGHVNKRTTSIYLRMDIDALRACPLDPGAVMA